ncbi:putative Iroquois-class homeodomain protein IRX-6-like [Homarus americanus]|uniref:Putative Iroquois-class homeodomain protein IRX-6-like n=1 Tax=Homarus americanus TaxID=6706 RepID=A0A8J5K323_HOMAM|nr:putative Iroquois-class homeodomain protein IRX-6-like [Homarus americanus]
MYWMTPLVSGTQLSPTPTAPTVSAAPTPTLSHAHLAVMYSPAAYSDQPTPYPLPTLGGEQSAFYSPTVSTWFANALLFSDGEKDKKDVEGGRSSTGAGGTGAGSPGIPPTDVAHPKPRIWSLADMATSGCVGGGSAGGLGGLSGGAGKMMGGGMARGLHLEGSPYSRPLFPHASYPYIPHSVSESLLSYSYTKSLAAGFPPVSLSDVTTASLLAPSPLVHDLSRHDLGRPEISRPEALRPDISRDLPRDLPRHELARPEPHRPEPRPPMDKDV